MRRRHNDGSAMAAGCLPVARQDSKMHVDGGIRCEAAGIYTLKHLPRLRQFSADASR